MLASKFLSDTFRLCISARQLSCQTSSIFSANPPATIALLCDFPCIPPRLPPRIIVTGQPDTITRALREARRCLDIGVTASATRGRAMALPKPNCSFVIPSVHDDLELNCRIYYPRRTEQNTELFGRSFAIFAHPYAPLGGCYDDPVVGFAGSVLLRGGCVLVTFNFR